MLQFKEEEINHAAAQSLSFPYHCAHMFFQSEEPGLCVMGLCGLALFVCFSINESINKAARRIYWVVSWGLCVGLARRQTGLTMEINH